MTAEDGRVLTLTMNPSLDKSSETDRVNPGRKLRCGPIMREPGGGGINVARVLERLGQPTTAVYVYGGATGDELAELLGDEQVRQCAIRIGAPIRESLMVMESGSDQQYRFSFPGPELPGADVKRCVDAMVDLATGSRLIVLSGSLPPGVSSGFYREMAGTLGRGGRRIIVDSHGAALKEALSEPVFLIKPNLGEFEDLVGESLPNDDAIERATRRLIEETAVEHIVVSLGAGGVALAWEDRFERIPSPTVQIRSRIGAGDSAVGGIVYGLAKGMSVYDAAQVGVAAGAAAVMSPGSQLCRRGDVERLFEGLTGRSLETGRASSEDRS